MGFDPAQFGQADYHAFAPGEVQLALDHKAMRRDVDHMQVHVAKPAVFTDDFVINRMPRRTAQIGHCQLSSSAHGPECLPFSCLSNG